ncbi:porphobilinogen deaminase [Thermosipho melanesiensis]|uniref:Hydroxymethylbilane synthase n=2 Tax=Thermosipho melanesiensis TaxID=46541 RepID=A6LKX0_THEM4|nr:hydroxymethylbilane synthase [Thermosipho melanesiensis]ABR30571.1 porphobilinogen deaminase [Thermosipho melanesiensis BI429]APT73719.1 porphobilinogen deaminase [Thermosipho melanesiensis]OOC35657.1 porphobilinogen deaminase [Thermosipho melanesiensis]OOC38956.1 porphobilinogen deaminase [Thermosipho melanesiensis]OOC39104.1 porphobilinogen deaminase [Thermosipho melanesiensis]
MKIRVGTRKSKLALIQTQLVVNKLKELLPNIDFEITPVVTKGDRLKTPIDKIGGKGVFVSDIEKLILDDKLDIAIHSMKDLPSKIPDKLFLTSVLKRECPNDVFIGKENFFNLKKGAKIGTSSKRRALQINMLRPDIEIVPIRGNVDTRIKKIGELDGIVIAAAGVIRLGLKDKITNLFEFEKIVPAPCQGILALEFSEKFLKPFEEIKDVIVDPKTEVETQIERKILSLLNFDCNTPFGFYCDASKKVTCYMFKNNERKKFTFESPEIEKILGEIIWE